MSADPSAERLRLLRPLTPTEEQIARALGRGLIPKQIAGEVGIAETTVKYHIRHIDGALLSDADSLVNFSPRQRVQMWAFLYYGPTEAGRAA